MAKDEPQERGGQTLYEQGQGAATPEVVAAAGLETVCLLYVLDYAYTCVMYV